MSTTTAIRAKPHEVFAISTKLADRAEQAIQLLTSSIGPTASGYWFSSTKLSAVNDRLKDIIILANKLGEMIR